MTSLRRFLLPLLAGVFVFGVWAILAGGGRTCTTGPLERGGGYCVDSPGLLSFVAAPSTVELVGSVLLWSAVAVVVVGELVAVAVLFYGRAREKREAREVSHESNSGV